MARGFPSPEVNASRVEAPVKLNCRKTLFLFLAHKHVPTSFALSLSLSLSLSVSHSISLSLCLSLLSRALCPNLAFSLSQLPPSRLFSASPRSSLSPFVLHSSRLSFQCLRSWLVSPFVSLNYVVLPSYFSIRDEIYPPSTHHRQPEFLPHPVPLAALFFQNRRTGKQEGKPPLRPSDSSTLSYKFNTARFSHPLFSFPLSSCFSRSSV